METESSDKLKEAWNMLVFFRDMFMCVVLFTMFHRAFIVGWLLLWVIYKMSKIDYYNVAEAGYM